MTDNKPSYESIKEKLRKIQALAESGEKGEAEAAKAMLRKLCEQYGVKMDDLLDSEKKGYRYFKIGREGIWLDLFVQCYAKVTGARNMGFSRISRSEIAVKLTAYQNVEIINLYAWHKENLKKDLEDTRSLVFQAYIQKHHLTPGRSNGQEDDEEEDEAKPVDFARLRAVMAMMETLNDNTYHKMIEKA